MAQATTSTGWCSTSAAGAADVVKVVYAILAVLMGLSLFLVVGPVNIGELFGGGGGSGNAAEPVRRTGRTDRSQTEERTRQTPTCCSA